MRTIALCVVAAVLLAGCPKPVPTVIPPDGGDPAACTRACTNLAVLGCPEMGDACVPTCVHVVTERITAFSPECVAAATSKKEVVRCPAIRCDEPR